MRQMSTLGRSAAGIALFTLLSGSLCTGSGGWNYPHAPTCVNGAPPPGTTWCKGNSQPPPTPQPVRSTSVCTGAAQASAVVISNLDYSSPVHRAVCPNESSLGSYSNLPVLPFVTYLTTAASPFTVRGFSDAPGANAQDINQLQDRLMPDVGAPNYNFFSQTPLLGPFADDDNPVSGGDAAELLLISGHGVQASYEVPPTVYGRQVFLFARSAPKAHPPPRKNSCRVNGPSHYVLFSDSQPEPIVYTRSEMALGAGTAGNGAKAASVIYFTSCSMNDNTWPLMDQFHRVGQEFGFEASPVIPNGDFLVAVLKDTLSMGNVEAWTTHGLTIQASNENQPIHAAAVASANGESPFASEDLLLNGAFMRSCRLGQKVNASYGGVIFRTWMKARPPFCESVACGPVRVCDVGYQPPPLGKNQQRLESSPLRSAPPPSMMSATLTPGPSFVTAADDGSGSAAEQGGLAEEGKAAQDVEDEREKEAGDD